MSPKTCITTAVLALTLMAGAAQAGEDKDTSGRLETWTVTKDMKVLGTETLRVVVKEDGKRFSSGAMKATLGKQKINRKSHIERGADGHLDKYQRVEAGMKGAGVKLFEFEGAMRIAPVNAPGKPTPLADLKVARVWDMDLWHLYGLWDLPATCGETRVGYLDPETKATAQATLTCKGNDTVWDADKKPVSVHLVEVGGVPNEVELWVDAKGGLVGAKGKDRWMLKAKWTWKPDEKAEGAGSDEPGGDDDEDKVDRGIGE